MKETPCGQKWIVGFTDKDGYPSSVVTNSFANLPRMIAQILYIGGSKIVIKDETIYKDKKMSPIGNVYHLHSRR